MAKTRNRLSKTEMLDAMGKHVLKRGLNDASLRPLAKAAGTSDRMLIYHFKNKAALIDTLLDHLGGQYAALLEAELPKERAKTRPELLRQILAATSGPKLQPYMSFWWQVVAEAVLGNAAFLQASGATMGMLREWLVAHMPADDPDPHAGADMLLTLIEGAQMLDAVGRGDIAEAGLAATFADR